MSHSHPPFLSFGCNSVPSASTSPICLGNSLQKLVSAEHSTKDIVEDTEAALNQGATLCYILDMLYQLLINCVCFSGDL